MSNSETVQFVQITADELAKLINQKLSENLNQFKKEFLNKEADNELLTREQTADFLKVDVSTLYLWVKKGKIKAYGIGKRRYFKRTELIESLTPIVNK
jgi:excisionase family DNA binding protein